MKQLSALGAVADLFDRHGGSMYLGEPVTQVEHALQCAWLAEQEGADASLIVAALLHDVGHLLCGLEAGMSGPEEDGKHEARGREWLSRFFGPDVTEPVRLHVEAKRYLCAADPQYARCLSEASRHSLMLQGGAMNAKEAVAFVSGRYADAAVRLRRWDDRAKIPGLPTPALVHYAARLEAVTTGRGRKR